MCTNRALVDSLECYMDDLVDCFEDFVKKSIIAISVAIGLLVGMIAYIFKMNNERTQTTTLADDTAQGRRRRPDLPQDSSTSLNIKEGIKIKKEGNVIKNNYMMLQDDKGTSTISANRTTDVPSFDEKVLRDIGFSGCSRTECTRKSPKCKLSTSRISIPSLPVDSPKCKDATQSAPDKFGPADSCCSMCCDNKCEG